MKKSVTLAVAIMVAGCHHRQPENATSCEPVREAAVQVGDLASLVGAHDVSFVVLSGTRSGQTVTGQLTLRSQSESLKRGPWSPAEQQAIGKLEMSPEDVGAVRMGEVNTDEQLQPGVAVYVAPAAGTNMTVTARVGTLSNTRGDQPYDAGYFTLYVREVTASGIRGGWASGDGRQEIAAGHFCTRRQSP